MIFNIGGVESVEGKMPDFSYSGICQLIDDGKVGNEQNWRIKFLTSGLLKFKKVVKNIDVFCVGGGGGGSTVGYHEGFGGGGAGGYTKTTKKVPISAGVEYAIIVGGGGAGAVQREADCQ